MSDPGEDLRSTEESIRWDRDAIRALEGERASLTADDPNMEALSERIEGLAGRVRHKRAAERDLLEELRGGGVEATPS
jgi:hypothetical protein